MKKAEKFVAECGGISIPAGISLSCGGGFMPSYSELRATTRKHTKKSVKKDTPKKTSKRLYQSALTIVEYIDDMLQKEGKNKLPKMVKNKITALKDAAQNYIDLVEMFI